MVQVVEITPQITETRLSINIMAAGDKATYADSASAAMVLRYISPIVRLSTKG